MPFVGDIFAEPQERFRKHLRIDNRVRDRRPQDGSVAVSLRFLMSTQRSSSEIASTLPNSSPPQLRRSSPPRSSVSCGGKR